MIMDNVLARMDMVEKNVIVAYNNFMGFLTARVLFDLPFHFLFGTLFLKIFIYRM